MIWSALTLFTKPPRIWQGIETFLREYVSVRAQEQSRAVSLRKTNLCVAIGGVNAISQSEATASKAEMMLITASASRRVFGTGAGLRSALVRLYAARRAARARQGVLAMPEHLLDDAGLNDQSVRAAVARRAAPRSAFVI